MNELGIALSLILSIYVRLAPVYRVVNILALQGI